MKTFCGGNHHQKGGRGGGNAASHRPSSGGVKKNQASKPKKNMSLKNRVRALERLIRLPPERLDPKVKAIKSAELLELKKQLGDHDKAELERKFAKKYHRVKFFERIKIERSIGKLEKKAKGGGQDDELQQQRLHQLKEDLEYVMNFPPGERYVSLLKDATDPSSQAHLDSERTRLRALIKHRMKELALVNEVDEGKSIKVSIDLADGKHKMSKARATAVVKDDKAEEEEEEEDDFFLEQVEGKEEGGLAMNKPKPLHQARLPLQLDDEDSEEDSEEDEDEEEEEETHLTRNGGGRGKDHHSHSSRGARGGGGGKGSVEEAAPKRKRAEGGRKRRK